MIQEIKNQIIYRNVNKTMIRGLAYLTISIVTIILLFSCARPDIISLEILLDEMVSFETMTRFTDPYYTCHQASSYDRGSVSPDSVNWFRNGDGYTGGSFVRTDTIDGRIEKVMLDVDSPGVITRFWITSLDRDPVIRFYFDGSTVPGLIIPQYDMMKMGIEGAGKGLVIPHTSYSENGGGSTSFFPVPYAKACKITVDIPEDVDGNPRYYQINYRKYNRSAKIETFSEEVALRAKMKIEEVNYLLLNPDVRTEGSIITKDSSRLNTGDSLLINLPDGKMAIHELAFEINVPDKDSFEQCMRELILSVKFDAKETIWVPIGDFSGGGMGSRPVSSWFLSSDGEGRIISRWLMPYHKNASIKLKNYSNEEICVSVVAETTGYNWDENSLYFHTSWKQETGLWLSNCGEDVNKPSCKEWDFATLNGRGVYRGDALTLFNHTKSWYGEGDEKIWVDNDTFPSHFGTGTEDYYNSSWAPVVIFQTPFGGAVRADNSSSRGYNTWLRTRNLDGIPFKSKLQFDLELLSWFRGKADYASTVYWYGDKNAEAITTSGIEEAGKILLSSYKSPSEDVQ